MAEVWLLIETSGRVGQVGLARNGVLVRNTPLDEARRHARDLMPQVATMLESESARVGEIAGVVVGIGPGSYTGLRVGIASAKAFAYAAGCPLIAVPMFAAIARQVPEEAARAWVVADALQGLVYVQEYQGIAAQGELRIEAAAQVLPTLPDETWITGPGLAAHQSLVPPQAKLVSEPARHPSLLSLYQASLALAPVTRQELFALEPLYLRGSSAEEKAKVEESSKGKANEPRG